MKQSTFAFDGGDGALLTGFRLQAMELYNWGTFHDKVWRLEPAGQTALLTGENGSGKSTLIDALLTLLVPSQKRNYNQAAGTGRKERTEMSYMRGAFGRVQTEEGNPSQVQFLRDKQHYSVLLGHFCNGPDKQDVTLAQFFWLDGENVVKKFFVVATRVLSIAGHFSQVESPQQLRKQLRQIGGVKVEDQFKKYSQHFCKLFGLRSDKALDLFNQTVTIKEVGELNEFVRQHMLEKTDAQEKIGQLQEHYENLMVAYQAMQKATEQLALLRPLAEIARKYEASAAEIAFLRGCEDAIPIYFSGKKWKLLQDAIAQEERALAVAQEQLRQEEERIGQLTDQVHELEVTLRTDAVGKQIEALAKEIAHLRSVQGMKQRQSAAYDGVARELGLGVYSTAAAFQQNQQRAQERKKELAQQQESWAEQLRLAQIEEDKLAQQGGALAEEIKSLRGRVSQIPTQNLHLRDTILNALDISPHDVPFVGELLRVKEQAQAWTGAIERLLHNFGLRLLVPERHYDRFVAYVNGHHLRGRIVFHRIPEKDHHRQGSDDPYALRYKLDIKPDTPYYDWLENELTNHYDYTCAETMPEFERASRAITQSGLSKSGGNRYEKDDRHRVDDASRYILGWSNKDKIRALEQELRQLENQRQQQKKLIEQAKAGQTQSQNQQWSVDKLLDFGQFADIDWRQEAQKITELTAQKERVEQSANHLQQIRLELEKTKQAQRAAQGKKDSYVGHISKLEADLKTHRRGLEVARKDVRTAGAEMNVYAPRIQEQVTVDITLENVDSLWRHVLGYFRQASETEHSRAAQFRGRVVTMMTKYKERYDAETKEFDASVEAIPAFDAELARIEQDDLPQHTERFRKLRNEKVLTAISVFQGELYNDMEEINENIANLNQSLQTIDYTPDTYIQLQTEANRAPEIREFQQMLRACLDDVGQQLTDEAYEASFAKVRDLITRFKEEPRWTARVTDVRYWLAFSAVERYRADDSQKHFYSDSSGKSGGQKAKLAYTILASAIAFQFGLERGAKQAKSFRFVVIDEAFSRSDEKNSHYAMKLFQELELQLLVVTPMTGIHIVEPYIQACHFVWNNREGNESQLATLTVGQLQAQRQAYQQRAGAA